MCVQKCFVFCFCFCCCCCFLFVFFFFFFSSASHQSTHVFGYLSFAGVQIQGLFSNGNCLGGTSDTHTTLAVRTGMFRELYLYGSQPV